MSESDKSLRSALGRARYLGSARRGSQDAWLTHVSAAALGPWEPLAISVRALFRQSQTKPMRSTA